MCEEQECGEKTVAFIDKARHIENHNIHILRLVSAHFYSKQLYICNYVMLVCLRINATSVVRRNLCYGLLVTHPRHAFPSSYTHVSTSYAQSLRWLATCDSNPKLVPM